MIYLEASYTEVHLAAVLFCAISGSAFPFGDGESSLHTGQLRQPGLFSVPFIVTPNAHFEF